MVVEEESNAQNVDIFIASNESAYGASPAAVSAGISAMHSIERYSESAPNILARAIAARFSLNEGGVVCGFGSDDILARIARAYLSAGDELIYSINGYQKIPNYAYANDAEAVAAPDSNFTADVDAILGCVTDSSRMVMIANPDNPTGSYISGKEVRRLRAGLPDNVLLVLDSAYREYVDAEDYEDPVRMVEDMDNVVMTRTFSKIFGLAGMRLGWAYAPNAVADILRRVGITFPVSNPALASGIAALEDTGHTSHVFSETRRIRQWFADVLTEHNVIVHPSQTNFLLATFPDPSRTAQQAYDYLREHDIIARRFPSPSFSDCIRFTIGLESEMSRTADVLDEFF
jgi:histidinol-phosphate aminotransferase